VAVTSINAAWLASNPQCDAALRCESTAPCPHANTAANHRPSRRNTLWPTAYTPRCKRRSRPTCTRWRTPRSPNPNARNCANDTTPNCRSANSANATSRGGLFSGRMMSVRQPTPRIHPLTALAAHHPERTAETASLAIAPAYRAIHITA
jgi:hypothetical protein